MSDIQVEPEILVLEGGRPESETQSLFIRSKAQPLVVQEVSLDGLPAVVEEMYQVDDKSLRIKVRATEFGGETRAKWAGDETKDLRIPVLVRSVREFSEE